MAVNPLDTTKLNLDAPLKAAQTIREYVEDLKTIPLPDHQATNETMQEIDLAAVVEDLGRVVAQHRAYMAIQQSIGVGDIPYADHSGALARLLDEIVQELRRLGTWSGNGILFKSSPAGMSASIDYAALPQQPIVAAGGEAKTVGISGRFTFIEDPHLRYDLDDHGLWLTVRGVTFEDGLAIDFEDTEELLVTTAKACP